MESRQADRDPSTDHLVTGEVRFTPRNSTSRPVASSLQCWTEAELSRAEPAVDVGAELDTTVQLLDMPAHNLAHVLFMISFDYPDWI